MGKPYQAGGVTHPNLKSKIQNPAASRVAAA